jgi:O-antigen/teichoic acid export membrane protein
VVAPILPIVVGKDFEGSVQMVRWLSPIVGLRAVGSCSINGLMGLNRLTLRTILIAANAALAVVLYNILIPMLGWEGAAIATVISEALSVVMTWTGLIVSQRIADRALDAELAMVDLVPQGAEHAAHSPEYLREPEAPLG